MLNNQGHIYARACTRPRARAHARTEARQCAHTQMYNIYYLSTVTIIRKRGLVLRYTYIFCLVSLLYTFFDNFFPSLKGEIIF